MEVERSRLCFYINDKNVYLINDKVKKVKKETLNEINKLKNKTENMCIESRESDNRHIVRIKSSNRNRKLYFQKNKLVYITHKYQLNHH